MNQFKITSSLEFNYSVHLIPHVFISIGEVGIHLYVYFLNLQFSFCIYFDVTKWDKPTFSLSTPSITVNEFNPDSTYLYYLDICWYKLLYRKSFWRINEDNNKYPYTLEQYNNFKEKGSHTYNEFISKLKELEKRGREIFTDDDDNNESD